MKGSVEQMKGAWDRKRVIYVKCDHDALKKEVEVKVRWEL